MSRNRVLIFTMRSFHHEEFMNLTVFYMYSIIILNPQVLYWNIFFSSYTFEKCLRK